MKLWATLKLSAIKNEKLENKKKKRNGSAFNLFKKVPGNRLHCTSFLSARVSDGHFVPPNTNHLVPIKNSHFVPSIRLACYLTCFKLSTNFSDTYFRGKIAWDLTTLFKTAKSETVTWRINASFPVSLGPSRVGEPAEWRRRTTCDRNVRGLGWTELLPKKKNTQPSLTLYTAAAWLAVSTLVPR